MQAHFWAGRYTGQHKGAFAHVRLRTGILEGFLIMPRVLLDHVVLLDRLVDRWVTLFRSQKSGSGRWDFDDLAMVFEQGALILQVMAG